MRRETDAVSHRLHAGDRYVVHIRSLLRVREQGGSRFELSVPAFDLEPGEFVAVVGESGCGKSTLLDLLALVLRPTSVGLFVIKQGRAGLPVNVGELWARGDEEALARARREVLGYVLQSGGLLPFLSVRRNIALSRQLKEGVAGDVTELAGRMGMEGLLDKKPQFLSGGQRQRAAILRAMAHRPAIILADEPTAAVDGTRARAIVGDFRRLAQAEGCAIVMVSHDLGLVGDFADRIYGYQVESRSDSLSLSACIAQTK
jgi:putative ABC transport system ATP-binding protein